MESLWEPNNGRRGLDFSAGPPTGLSIDLSVDLSVDLSPGDRLSSPS